VFKYFLGDVVKKPKSNGNNSASSATDISGAKVEKTKDVEFEEAIRDLRILWIGKYVVHYSHLLHIGLYLLETVSLFFTFCDEFSHSIDGKAYCIGLLSFVQLLLNTSAR